jgi:ribosomal protein S18 acetylase RimI-like enzyme
MDARPQLITYRFLGPDDFSEVHQTVLRSFADYSVPVHPSPEQLLELARRRGVRWDLSVGAFYGGEMIGVSATGLGVWMGKKTAYDCFTGVVPNHRGMRITGQMFDTMRERLASEGATQFLLEVIQTNRSAVRAYRRIGFVEQREFICYSREKKPVGSHDVSGLEIRTSHSSNWESWQSFQDWLPSWQNSRDSIERSSENFEFLEAWRDSGCVGYAILSPETGDVPQFAVSQSHRRSGIATSLLHAMLNHPSSAERLYFINVDKNFLPDQAFLRSLGADETVRQSEMILKL